MKKLFFLAVFFSAFSLTNNLIAQPAYPTGFLSGYTIFIDSNWNVVILVTCNPPHTEYCTTTPREKSSVGQALVENLNKAIGKESDWEIELYESNSFSRIYKFTSKKSIIDEPNRVTNLKLE